MTYGFIVGNNPINDTDPDGLRPLSDDEKGILSPYIPKIDLDNANVTVGKLPSINMSSKTIAMTIGSEIYFRDPAQTFNTPADLALLGHELVHVGQYRNGMTFLGYGVSCIPRGYRLSSREVPAYNLQYKIEAELEDKMKGGMLFDLKRKRH